MLVPRTGRTRFMHRRRATWLQELWQGVAAVALAVCLAAPVAAQVLVDQGGPVMHAPRVFPIFWLPPGAHFDASGTAAADTAFEQTVQQFFADVSAGDYLNIVSQYPGECGLSAAPASTPCFDDVTVSPSPPNAVVETRAYPHAGTVDDPLSDLDIGSIVRDFVAANHISPGLDTLFVVVLGWGINECMGTGGMISGNQCAGRNFCGYHGAVTLPGGTLAFHAVLPDAQSFIGCQVTATTPNQQAADAVIVVASHELAEAITNPDGRRPAWTSNFAYGEEVGDYCHYAPFGALRADGSNVTLNGHNYLAQTLWSNDDDACAAGYPYAMRGATIEVVGRTATGPKPPVDATVVAHPDVWQGGTRDVWLHLPGQRSWAESQPLVRVALWPRPMSGPMLKGMRIQLTSGATGNGQWTFNRLEVRVRNPNGSLFCDDGAAGEPLGTVTDGQTFWLSSSTCRGVERVRCSVFDDGYADSRGPADAVFISGRTTNGEQGKACIPGGTFGQCRKWFGQCKTEVTGQPVYFIAFNDGYALPTVKSDAVYIPKAGNQACVPDATSVGDCRRWFGRGTTDDGRDVTCAVFNDGYADESALADAVYIPSPIPGPGKACIPDAGPVGICGRWFGRCMAH